MVFSFLVSAGSYLSRHRALSQQSGIFGFLNSHPVSPTRFGYFVLR